MKEMKVKRFLIIVMMMTCLFSYANMYRPNLGIADFTTVSTSSTFSRILDETPEQQLIREVDRYIDRVSPNSDRLLAEHIVKYSLEYNLDICFVLAQTQIETKFGTLGVGRSSSRYSLFGVCRKYSSYEDAVKDYCKLIRNSYLGDSRTINDLMRNYVTLRGGRYASDRGYERKLKNQYNHIKGNTSIYDIQRSLKIGI